MEWPRGLTANIERVGEGKSQVEALRACDDDDDDMGDSGGAAVGVSGGGGSTEGARLEGK